jgi:flagellar biosynthesis protein FlhF
MDRVRRELGPDAVILSNRRIDAQRIEVIAAAPDEMRALVDDLQPVAGRGAEPSLRERRAPMAPAAASAAFEASHAQATRSRLASVSIPRRAAPEPFAEFIRRQSRARMPSGEEAVAMYASVAQSPSAPAIRAEGNAPPSASMPLICAEPAPGSIPAVAAAVFRRRPSRLEVQVERRAAPPSMPMPVAQPLASAPPASPSAQAGAAPPRDPVMAELRALRSTLSDRIAHLESDVATRGYPGGAALRATAKPAAPAAAIPVALAAQPAQAASREVPQGRSAATRATVARMLMSGFSPELSRRLGAQVPQDLDAEGMAQWLQAALARDLQCPAEAENPLAAPGAIALTGPTGVGKTTTIAKLAARWVVRHGAAGLGLVTLDSYRMGAHEQLRSYGRILGVPVHSAQDASTLADLMRSLQDKRQVLIDTCGMSQRDARLSDMLAMLGAARFHGEPVQRVLLLNAASHAETLDEVARNWLVESSCGCVVTKIDEAARIGGALDCLIRYRAQLLGLTNGQRVPEDWHAGNAQLLAHLALKPFGAAFCLEPGEAHTLSVATEARVAHA